MLLTSTVPGGASTLNPGYSIILLMSYVSVIYNTECTTVHKYNSIMFSTSTQSVNGFVEMIKPVWLCNLLQLNGANLVSRILTTISDTADTDRHKV